MARHLNSEAKAQRVLFAYFRGKEDRETGKPCRVPEGCKQMLYKAYYEGGYHGVETDVSVWEEEETSHG